MTRKGCIWLLILLWLALPGLTAYAQGLRTPLGRFRWGRYQEEKKMSREQAAAKYNYCPTGSFIRASRWARPKPCPPAI